MDSKDIIKIKPHSHYTERFLKKLMEPISVVEPLTSLCGGCIHYHIKGISKHSNKL